MWLWQADPPPTSSYQAEDSALRPRRQRVDRTAPAAWEQPRRRSVEREEYRGAAPGVAPGKTASRRSRRPDREPSVTKEAPPARASGDAAAAEEAPADEHGPFAFLARSFLLPYPWGSPLMLLIAALVLAAAGFAVYKAYARAFENLRKPATRSGTFRIGDTDAPQKVFPQFGIIVCPLDPAAMVRVRYMQNLSQVQEFVRAAIAPAPPPPAANSSAPLPGQGGPKARAAQAVVRSARGAAARGLLLASSPPMPGTPNAPPAPEAPPTPEAPLAPDSSSFVSSATASIEAIAAWCASFYYTGGGESALFYAYLRVFGAPYTDLSFWNDAGAAAFADNVAAAWAPLLSTGAGNVTAYTPWLSVSDDGTTVLGNSVDLYVQVSLTPAFAPLLVAGSVYAAQLQPLLNRAVFANISTPAIMLLMDGPIFPGQLYASMTTSSSSSDTNEGTQTEQDSSSSATDRQLQIYDYYCLQGGGGGGSMSESSDKNSSYSVAIDTTWATALATGGGSSSSSDAMADLAPEQAAAQTTAELLAPWVTNVVTFAGVTAAASFNESVARALVHAVLFDSLKSLVPGAELVNVSKLAQSGSTDSLNAKLAITLQGITVRILPPADATITPVPVVSPAAGRRRGLARRLLLTAPTTAPPAAPGITFAVAVQCGVTLSAQRVTDALSQQLTAARAKALLPGLPALAQLSAVQPAGVWAESAVPTGALPYKALFADGVLPLFGFIENAASCTRVGIKSAAFTPALADTFLSPTGSNASGSTAAAQVNLEVTVPYAKEVVVGIYEASRGLPSLGSFIILKDTAAGLVNLPRISAALSKTLPPYSSSLRDLAASLFSGKRGGSKDDGYIYKWRLSLQSGDGINQPDVRAPSLTPAAAAAAAAPPGAGQPEGSTSVYVVNMQSYFVDFTVRFTEEFYAYEVADAVSNMFTYINTVTLVLSILTPLMLAKVLNTLTLALKALARGDLKALAEHAKALAEHGKTLKQIGKLKLSGDDEEEEEEEEEKKAAPAKKAYKSDIAAESSKRGKSTGDAKASRRADDGRGAARRRSPSPQAAAGYARPRSAPARPALPPRPRPPRDGRF